MPSEWFLSTVFAAGCPYYIYDLGKIELIVDAYVGPVPLKPIFPFAPEANLSSFLSIFQHVGRHFFLSYEPLPYGACA